MTSNDHAEAVLIPAGDLVLGIYQARVAEITERLKEQADPIFMTQKPREIVTVRDCYIDRYLVTNHRYADFMAATGHPAPFFWEDTHWNKPEYPVVGVSCRDAKAFAQWARKRLPTEEEWERAARGTNERIWPWGDEFDRRHCNSKEWNAGGATGVKMLPDGVSPIGAHDMAGNVWQMTSGNWEGMGKAIRGGSFQNGPAYCRTTCRWGIDSEMKGSVWLGFRCAIDLVEARIFGKPS